MADAVMSLQCTVTVTDWKNVILGFPAHDFDTKWLITIPMALSSWQLFEAIYATEEDTSKLPGVPANEKDEEDKVNGDKYHYKNGKKKVPKGSVRIRRDVRNVKSEDFKDFIRSQGKSFKNSEWKKVMETWETPEGDTIEVHYWYNKVTGETWSH